MNVAYRDDGPGQKRKVSCDGVMKLKVDLTSGCNFALGGKVFVT